MDKFLEILNNYDKVVINIGIYNKEDLFGLTETEFDVYDYVQTNDYIKLYQQNGSEFILPYNEIKYDEEDESWYYETGEIKIYFFIEEKN